MSSTKEVKTLLLDLRQQLDEELRAKVEPLLRGILDASKPRTIKEVEYRKDPKDKMEIEALRAAIVSKDELIRQLQFKLASPPPLLDHMSFDDRLNQIDDRARAWADCVVKCMHLMRPNDAYWRRRKEILERWMRLLIVGLGNYLRILEGCDRIDPEKLRSLVDENGVQSLKKLARDIHAVSGVTVDVDLPPLGALHPPGKKPPVA